MFIRNNLRICRPNKNVLSTDSYVAAGFYLFEVEKVPAVKMYDWIGN